ncbi:MAG: hypothetical protein Q7U27_00375 [Pseudomonas sp.]|uniref:hypothetical protein n=1 Tax=Pseudomonas sp. TaxID=306 RepID=UPI002717B8A4|nr:hypothetical protein [Pseudomonas sp.]MDO9327165.1 hypothetical protein [Pseudomonas sp.]
MTRFAAACVLGILSGCASPPPATPATPPYRQPVLTVQEVFKKTPLENSVMRNGDTLSFQVHTPAYTRDGLPSVVQLQADCKVPDVKLLFLDNFPIATTDGSHQHTPLTVLIPKELATELASKPHFSEACTRTAASDWRIVHRTEAARWVMIDVNSLKIEGNVRRFWGGFDEPVLLTDKPNLQLFGQTRERYEVDCARKTYRVLSSFQLGPNDRVSMGGVLNNPSQAFAQGSADTQTLLSAACTAPPPRSTLPAYVARAKLSLSYQIEPVSASVLKAITDLKLAPPTRTLKRTVSKINNTHFYFSNSSTENALVFDTDAQSGQLRERREQAPVGRYIVSFRGLLPLAEQYSLTESKRNRPPLSTVTDTQQLSFTGDWQRMPVGASLEMRASKRERSTLDGETMKRESVQCTVQRVLDAAQVNSELEGPAKELRCQFDLGQKLKRDSKIFYLEDYAYFFVSSSTLGGTESRVRLVKVEQ